MVFQNQEIAFVVADDRYVAADAAELVEVEYEELPAVVDPFKALAPDAPVIREDIREKMVGAHGARRHHNHIFSWQIGDKCKTSRAFDNAEVTVRQDMLYPRVHPCRLENCGCVASLVLGRPVKWIESRSENLTATAFARDYHMTGELAAGRDGRIKALRVRVTADHGAFDA